MDSQYSPQRAGMLEEQGLWDMEPEGTSGYKRSKIQNARLVAGACRGLCGDQFATCPQWNPGKLAVARHAVAPDLLSVRRVSEDDLLRAGWGIGLCDANEPLFEQSEVVGGLNSLACLI